MDDLCAKLRNLAEGGNVPAKVRKRAALLLDRISTPLQITVAGPDTQVGAQVAQNLPKDTPLMARIDDIGSADIAVWCTQTFGAQEIAFWDAAPEHLQDHSLLVGPADPHIHSMAAAYFRQWCSAETVVETLLQRIARGREADADQACALLALHPSDLPIGPATQPLQPKCRIGEYIQSQADKLFGMDVQDTTESLEAVLNTCAQTAHELSEMLLNVPDKTLQDAAFDAVDAITLMRLEGDTAAAVEAVTLLIGLKSQINQLGVSQIETCTVQ